MDLEETWNDVVETVIEVVPKLVAFLLILLIGWIVAKLLSRLTNALLERVHFDRAVERGGLRLQQIDASDLLAKVVYFALLLVTLMLAFNVFGPNPVSSMLNSVVAWLPQLFVGIVIIVVAAFLANLVRDLVRSALSSFRFGGFVATAAWVFVLAIGIIAALGQMGIATTVTGPVLIAVLATIAGVIVVGVGGGLVRPMQARWERWLESVEEETRTGLQRQRGEAATLPPPSGPASTPTVSPTPTTTQTPAPGSFTDPVV